MNSSDKNKARMDSIMRYANLIQKQSGKAVRPYRFENAYRADGYVNVLNRYGTSKDASEHYQFEPEPTVSDDLLTMFYEGNGLFAKIIDTPAEESIKHGFTLEDISDQQIETFYREAYEELDGDEIFMTGIKWARLFGGSIAVMLINDGRGIDEPLDWSNIQSIDDIRIYDRSLIQPDYSSMFSYDPRDPFRTRGSRLGMPEYYYVFSKYGNFTVHESRCLVFQNGILPENCTNSVYQLWGMPEYIRIQRAIRDAELAHGAAPKMLDKSVQAIYKMKDLAATLATEQGEDAVLKRLQVIDLARGLLNSITIDSENEDYDFKQFQFSGVSEIIDKTCAHLSSLTNIPQAILFGQGAGGLSTTDDTSMENWYNYCERIQRRMVKSNLRYLLAIVFQAGVATGEIPDVPPIKVKFNPLWSLSESEQVDLEQKRAQVQSTKSQTANTYVQMGAIDPSEVRKKLAASEEFDIENMLDDVEEEDLMKVFEEQMAQQQAEGEVSVNGEVVETGNSPDSAPAATKLPQDLNGEDIVQKEEGEQNQDDADDSKKIGGVGVLVVQDGKILCGKRHNDFGYGLVCGPGGHVESGETPEQAACRETQEEFGIKPINLTPLGLGPTEPDTGLTPMIFLCTEFEGEPECDDLEMVNPQFCTLEEIEQSRSGLFQPFADSIDLLNEVLFGGDSAENGETEMDGGPGSGNFGHEGVKGQIGGSAPAGSDVGGEEHKPISERSTPSVKSPKGFDNYVKENGLTPIYRGYSAESDEQLAEYRESYKNGTVPESGEKSSALGKGVYFSTSQSEAEGYMSRRQGEKGESKGRVTTAALDIDAKVGDYNELKQKKLQDESDAIQKAFEAKASGKNDEYNKLRDAYYDIAEMSFEDYVRSQGYDAIQEPALGYIVVMNQKALVVRDDSINSTFLEKPIDFSADSSIIKSQETTDENADGGSGSGNFGHKGVKGQTGGSAPSGSASEATKFKTSGTSMEISSDLSLKYGKKGKETATIKQGRKIEGIYSFAGKGSSENLVVSGLLSQQFGGKPQDWSHKCGFAPIVCPNGEEIERAEIHWFEHDDVGQIKFKVKYREEGDNR